MGQDWPYWWQASTKVGCERRCLYGRSLFLRWLLAQTRSLFQWHFLLWSWPKNMVRYRNLRRSTKSENWPHSGALWRSIVCLWRVRWKSQIQWPLAMHFKIAKVQVEADTDGRNLTTEQIWTCGSGVQQFDVYHWRVERPRHNGRHLPVQLPVKSLVWNPSPQGSPTKATLQTLSCRHEKDYLYLWRSWHKLATFQWLV